MPNPQFAFLHVGTDTTAPAILVRSIRANNPEAAILQCSDRDSPEIAGVDRVLRLEPRDSKLLMMTFRLQCFAALDVSTPTLFLDTDMMCLTAIDPAALLAGNDVAVCEREFEAGVSFNTKMMDLDFGEYAGRFLGEVYPYVACTTVTASGGFWSDALERLLAMHPKFHAWFGDQEAIRNLVNSEKYRVTLLPESIYARLPDLPVRVGAKPKIYHFKGAARKPVMLDLARKAGYL